MSKFCDLRTTGQRDRVSICKMSAFILTFLSFLAFSTGFPTPGSSLHARQNGHLNSQSSQGTWDAGAVTEFPIHSSCNASEARQIRTGLGEAVELAEHAKEHVLRWGNESEHYRRYFGNAPSGEVIGNLDKIVSGDKGGVLFRCDDPDGNCALDGKNELEDHRQLMTPK